MTLVNFKLSTLVLVASFTFSLNVFSAKFCMSDDEEFQDETFVQEEPNLQYKDILEDDILPKTNEEYLDISTENTDYLSASSELDIAATTGEVLDETESVISVSSVTGETITLLDSLGDVLGPAGLVVMLSLSVIQGIHVFMDPNSTDLDKVTAVFGWIPIIGLPFLIADQNDNKKRRWAELSQKLEALNSTEHYKYRASAEETQEAILAKVRPALERGVTQDLAAVKKIVIGYNAKLSKRYQSEYLHNVSLLQKHLKHFFADKWIKASPIFIELIDFINKSNNSRNVVDVDVDVIQDDQQWHPLTANGLAYFTSITGLDKFTYTSSFGNKITQLYTDTFVIKSTVLDNTWIIGERYPTREAHHLVVTLRDTPNQDEGVEYSTYSILNSDNFVTLDAELATTNNFENAGWEIVTSGYTATGLETSFTRAGVPIPSIISQQTITLCGIDDNDVDFLSGKEIQKIDKCLDSVLLDYKNYFSAYDSNRIIKVDTRDEKIVDSTLIKLLQTYGQSYNHLLAQAKIKIINNFYREKEPLNTQICQLYYDNAKKVLARAASIMTASAKKNFYKENHINRKGQSLNRECWDRECTHWHNNGVMRNKVPNMYCAGIWVDKYICSITKYTPTKDPVLDLAVNIVHQQVIDDRQNCLNRRDDAPIIFARKLTKLGSFYLDKDNSGVLFEEIFEGVKVALIQRFIKDIKISQLSKKQNIQ